MSLSPLASEYEPLLLDSPLNGARVKKPFYRPRQLWISPFFLIAALTRGMTISSRVAVYTDLACTQVHWKNPTTNHTLHPVVLSHAVTQPSSTRIIVPAHIDLDGVRFDAFSESRAPSRCPDTPAIQAEAAQLQALQITTMGLLSAVTSGWWGHFSERHGRLKVMAIATLGLLLTDLTFGLVSSSSLPFLSGSHSAYFAARSLLVAVSALEGLLGGWSALQSVSTAYVSDCTDSGSRSHIFSRLIGLMFLGVSLGPALGAWLFRNPLSILGANASITTIFVLATGFSTFNLLCAVFVFPESVSKEKLEAARVAARDAASTETLESSQSWRIIKPITAVLHPLKAFLPFRMATPGGAIKTDWSLTLLAGASFLLLLSTGVYQLKYLYAGHIYQWGTEQLSYFVTLIAGARAVYTIFIFPLIASYFKPKPPQDLSPTDDAEGFLPQGSMSAHSSSSPSPSPLPLPKPSSLSQLKYLAEELHFDLLLAKCGLALDIISNVLVCATPLPVLPTTSNKATFSLAEYSEPIFLFAAVFGSLGSGSMPVFQSLALCIVRAREVMIDLTQTQGGRVENDRENLTKVLTPGHLFGGLAVLQALGQMIVGPALFGMIYSSTVAGFPQAIFVVCAAILIVTILLVALIRPPISLPEATSRDNTEESRGRSMTRRRQRTDGSNSGNLRDGYGATQAASTEP